MIDDLDHAPDLVTLLRRHAAERPQAEAVAFLADPDDPVGGLRRRTYAELDREARGRAAWLQQHLAPGSRVLLLHPNGLEFVAAFLGCLYAGMIAIPAPLPGRYRHQRQRLVGIAADAGIGAVLTTCADAAEVREWLAGSGTADVPVVAGDEPGLDGDADAWTPVPLDRSTTALLQYTSGSTGSPKGVVVRHGNILHNALAGMRGMTWPEDMRLGGWLPLYHDMGLNAQLLWGLLAGGSAVQMQPSAFVRRPLRWLRLIDAYGVNVSFAPNFAFELCLRKIGEADVAGLDLSRWDVAVCGSEPIDPLVLAAFAQRFAPAGFRPQSLLPGYGLAEATLYVSGRRGRTPLTTRVDLGALARGTFVPATRGGATREVISCGPPTEACEIRVVDPDSREVLPEGRLGEIWVRGPGVAGGYWGHGDGGGVFGARTALGEDGDHLRTGDLGVLHDGELYVQGRLKDMLIVHGRNVYPQDVEQELRVHHPELGRVGVVFDTGTNGSSAGSAEVVVTHEVTGVPQERLPALAAAMRHTVGREFGVRVGTVALLSPGTVLRTTSGKVQRSAMRELFHEGRLASLYRDPQ
ncbi:fatty acyl-AMP ligase [Embleya sp. NBC_00888]|uniref:fatty acyl-AMP ligase n=1 Tax=Embleya sp. NBC_00888 TaxID=2975960 RepID=UPI00386B56CE|nr:fatty acyl-AMP ligase [Embleya sp. NBC_00888]